MTAREFWYNVQAHPNLEYGCVSDDGQVRIGFRPYARESAAFNITILGSASHKHLIVWSIDPKSIYEVEWEQLLEVLVGNRAPKAMRHIVSVDAYHACLRNRYRSRIEELADRHNGNYGVPEVVEVAA